MRIVLTGLCATLALVAFLWAREGRPGRSASVTKNEVAKLLGKRLVTSQQLQDDKINVQYSIDQHLQDTIESLMNRAQVPYGAFVALDPSTGQVLAMVSHGMGGENLALRSSFPAASLFKVVTAAAALESKKLSHDSLIPVRGSYHTLFKRNVLAGGGLTPDTSPRYARLISFEEALAKSVNSVFGKVGLFGVGAGGLRKVAGDFMFNKPIDFELPVDMSQSLIPDDEFGVAESASGYTRNNTLSPLHAALIAAIVANDGILMEPSIVNHLVSKDGKVEYSFQPKQLGRVIDKPTADELAMMMHKTIVDGTSRRAFRTVSHSTVLNDAFIGGKTGTLNGWSPPGRYDWFIGFAGRNNSKIAVATLCIHGERHGIKASQIARAAFETFYGSTIADSELQPFQRSRRHRRHRHSHHRVTAQLDAKRDNI